MTKQKQKLTIERTPLEHFLIFLPVVLLLAILPNVLFMVIDTTVSKADAELFMAEVNEQGVTYLTDIFSQAKAAVLVFFAAVMVVAAVLLCRWLFKNSDRKAKLYLILSGVFMLMTLLSTIFADVQESAWFGVFDRAEGFFTILCYFVIFLYTYYSFKKTDNYKYVICALFVVVLVNVVLGAMQFIGQDLTQNNFFVNLIVPYVYRNQDVDITLLNESGKLYGTMYHYNYMGSFCAIILPIFTTHVFFEKRPISKAFFIVFDFAALFLLIGSTSRGGLIGVIIAALVAIVIFFRIIIKHIKVVSIVSGLVIVIFVGAGAVTKWEVFNRIPAMLGDIGTALTDTSDFDYHEKLYIKDIQNVENNVKLVTINNDTVYIGFDTFTGKITFTTEDGSILEYTDTEGIFSFESPILSGYSFNALSSVGNPDEYDFITLIMKDKWYYCFKVINSEKVTLVDYYYGEPETIANPEVFQYFVGKERLGSMRGYIWGRALPLLRDTVITGFGPDNFVYEFPQNDYLGKYYAYGTPIQTVDKPHNLYLQIALGEGVIALLAFLALVGIYIVDSLRLYALRKEYNKPQIMGIGVMLGVIGYLGAGFFNDSIISVAPVFWVILGLGAALNGINRLEEHPELATSKRAMLKAEREAAVKEAEKARLDAEYTEKARAVLEKMDREQKQRHEELEERIHDRAASRGKVTLDDVLKFAKPADENSDAADVSNGTDGVKDELDINDGNDEKAEDFSESMTDDSAPNGDANNSDSLNDESTDNIKTSVSNGLDNENNSAKS